jgi:hypothetical protein
MIQKFSQGAGPIESIHGSRAFLLYQALESVNGNFTKLPDNIKQEIENQFGELWNSNTYRYGIVKIAGWQIDYSNWLKTYWIKTKHNGILEVKAFNKTLVRKCSTSPSHILRIVDVTKEE